MKKIILFICGFFSTPILNAQSGGVGSGGAGQNGPYGMYKSSQRYVPATPEATQFQKYGDIPVDCRTGVADISVPIYSFKLNGFEWPVSLSYHSSGNKVGDIASNVGLGWTLNAGGMISSKVMGLPDALFAGSANYNSQFQRKEMFGVQTSVTFPVLHFFYDPLVPCGTNINTADRAYISNAMAGQGEDPLPDIHYYNFGPYNGKFYSGAGCIPRNDLIFNGTQITDGKGNLYIFQQMGGNVTLHPCAGNAPDLTYTTNPNYCLTKVITYLKDTLSFFYDEYNVSYSLRPTVYHNEKLPVSSPANSTWCDYSTSVPQPGCGVVEHQYTATEERLTRISSSSGISAEFSYASRSDLPGAYKLTGIEIKNSENQRISKFDLQSNYSGTGSDPGDLRLKLNRINIQDINGTTVNAYNLYYNQTVLPNRMSYNTDSAGYYNGTLNSGGENLLSFHAMNVDYAQAEILKKIEYPTGGFSEFSYELNTTGLGGLRIAKVTSTDGMTSANRVKSYKYTFNRLPYIYSFTKDLNYFYFHLVVNHYLASSCPYRTHSSEADALFLYQYNTPDGYDEVEEINGENGKTVLTYSVPEFYSYATYFGNPELTEKKIYKKEGNEYQILSSVKNDYAFDLIAGLTAEDEPDLLNSYEKRAWGKNFVQLMENSTHPGETDFPVDPPPEIPDPQPTKPEWYVCEAFEVQTVKLISNALRLKKTTEKSYTYSTGNIPKEMVNITEYNYDDKSILSPSSTTTTNSKGETQTVKYYYPKDYASITGVTTQEQAAYSLLNDQNIKEQSIVTESYLNNQLKEKTRTAYNIANDIFNVALPSRITYFPTGTSLKKEVSIESYDQRYHEKLIKNPDGTSRFLVHDDYKPYNKAMITGSGNIFGAYSDFENLSKGNWQYNVEGRTNSMAFTGKYSYTLGSGDITVFLNRLTCTGDYIIGFWKTGGSASVNSGSVTVKKSAGSWVYVEKIITGSETNISISGTATIDDVVLYPLHGDIKTFVFNANEQLIGTQTGSTAEVAKYFYDPANRLYKITDEKNNILKMMEYHTENPPLKIVYGNEFKWSDLSRTCSQGMISLPIHYEVPAGKFSSFISVADANSFAQNDINIVGQTLANNTPSTECFIPTYFRVSYANMSTPLVYPVTGDVVIEFFADYQCTIPKTVNQLSLKYKRGTLAPEDHLFTGASSFTILETFTDESNGTIINSDYRLLPDLRPSVGVLKGDLSL